MIKKLNKTTIGAFVVGGAVLLVIAIMVFGSGMFFKQSDKYILFFNGSVKGLSEGAPVVFRGVKIGNVSSVSLLYDVQTKEVLIPVVIDVELEQVKGVPDKLGYPDYMMLVKQGLRVKLEIQNFITGQLMIGLDFYPDDPIKLCNLTNKYPELPTLPISADIFKVMEEIPIKEIANNLEKAVAGINRLVNSEGVSELDRTLREVTQAARNFALLTEYLEEHPESILKGKVNSKGD